MAEIKNIEEFDFKDYCRECGWCCHGESPFVSEDELKEVNCESSREDEGKPCIFLANGLCSKYDKRPFDCRIFPLDIKKIDGKIMWILWENCPLIPHINIDKFMTYLETELSKKYSFKHILNHISHDNSNLPDKYAKIKFRVLREVSWVR